MADGFIGHCARVGVVPPRRAGVRPCRDGDRLRLPGSPRLSPKAHTRRSQGQLVGHVGRPPVEPKLVLLLVLLLIWKLALVEPPLTVVASEGRLGRQGDLIDALGTVIQPGMEFLTSHVVVSLSWVDRLQTRPPRWTAVVIEVLEPLPAFLGDGIAEARIPTGARACEEARATGPE